MQDCDSTLLEVYVIHIKGQSLRNPTAQAKQKPDKQPIAQAAGSLLHQLYIQKLKISLHYFLCQHSASSAERNVA